MLQKTIVAGVTILLSLGGHAAAYADNAPLLAEQTTEEQEGIAGKELLMFMEEKDLVTATKRTVSLRKAPAIATIITSDEIRSMGARNLLDILKTVPGIGISTTVYGLPMVEVRGIRTDVSEKILVMVDGHSLNNNITGSAFYTFIGMLPIENIRQVEIIRGPGSALYGTSAFVATINIITRNAEEIDGIEVKAGGGSFDTWKANLVGGTTVGDKLTISASIDQYHTNGPRLNVAADTLTGTQFSQFSQAPGAPLMGERQTDVFLKASYGDLFLRGGYRALRKDQYIGFGYALTDRNYADQDILWGELAYAQALSTTLNATVKLRYDYFSQDPYVKIYPNGFEPIAGVSWPNGMIGKPLAKDRTLGCELQVDWDVFSGNHLIAGFSFDSIKQYDVKQQANFDPITGAPHPSVQQVVNWNKDVTREIWALYLQDEWQLPHEITLTGGMRYDHYSDFGDTINPRLALVWSFLENADLKLLYGQAFRAPSFQELYNIHNPAQLGNSRLKPEKIETFEGGLAYRPSRYLGADANYFYSTIDNQIDVDQSATPAPTYGNIRKSITQGIEFGLNGTVADLSWKANYAWQDPRDGDTGRRLPFVPSHRASGNINYAMNRHLNLHTDLLWTGSRLRAAGDSRKKVPDHTTVDVTATLKNFWSTLEIQATIRNLFDSRYRDPDSSTGAIGSQNLAGTGPKVPGDFPREGISGFVTASYRF